MKLSFKKTQKLIKINEKLTIMDAKMILKVILA